MKKFYTLASSHKNPDTRTYEIRLDGRPVKCPSGRLLTTGSKALAENIAQEWNAQKDTILPDSMPLTQILTTQIDRVAQERQTMSRAVLNYLDTDLLCYRAGPQPPGQAKTQAESWDPWLEWFETQSGTALKTTSALSALTQPPEAHNYARKTVEALDDGRFTVLQLAVSLSGSLVLGLAFTSRAITPQQLFSATHVEEHFKAKIHNEALHGPAPAQEKQDAAMMRDLKAAALFLELIENA